MRPFGRLLQRLRRDAGLAAADELGDAQLLELFARQHDEAAFTVLVRRHGPLVLGVCRRVLRDIDDAEDAFQATFLILARKADTIGKRDSLSSWLYGVAYRTSLKARTRATRRREREAEAGQRANGRAKANAHTAELRELLDEELSRLPRNYRTAVVLHHLQGHSVEEAARQLGWKEGQFRGALYRGRLLLQERLLRRGTALAGGLAMCLATESLSAAVPPMLGAATAEAALGGGLAGEVSPNVAWLVTQGTRNMMLCNLKTVGVLLLMAGSFGTGAAVSRVYGPPVPPPPAPETAPPAPAVPAAAQSAPPAERKDLLRVPSARDGILFEVAVKEGSPVQQGDLLFRLDDRLAVAEKRIKEYKLKASEAEGTASEKTRDEAYQRWQTQVRLMARNAVSAEDVRAAELTYIRYQQEALSKKEAIALAKAEVEEAQSILDLHTVRSPASGVVHSLLKKRGEAVNRLETVLILATFEPK
jgi:RNA polymerase sigma-70 factor (ECF subfamily)